MKSNPEFGNFTKVMDGLMAVPYKELQGKLREHKQSKRKRNRVRRPASRALERFFLIKEVLLLLHCSIADEFFIGEPLADDL